MSVALICGRLDDDKFQGRNTFPLLGRPMMAYPVLAALHARRVTKVFVTTDSAVIEQVAKHFGAEVIRRPPELSGPAVSFPRIVAHGFEEIRRRLGSTPNSLTVLICNAPTVTAGMIDHGIETLLKDTALDGVLSVSLHNEFHPAYSLQLDGHGSLQFHVTAPPADGGKQDVYFPDALLWVLRPRVLQASGAGADQSMAKPARTRARGKRSDWLLDPARHAVRPLIHEGYGDVDHVWQVPAIEQWLRQQGFSEQTTPYDHLERKNEVRKATAPPPRKSRIDWRVLITTVPFGEVDRRPLEHLEAEGIDYVINPLRRRLTEVELADMIGETRVLIAGTEPITAKVMSQAPKLRLIARVGIGLDNVDLIAARERGILVSYTPDAPAPAVAELTVGMMLASLRSIAQADRSLRNGIWHRISGRRLAELAIGIIGVGRVGKRVIRHLSAFGPTILANDLLPDLDFGNLYGVRWVSKEEVYKQADIISLHLPLTSQTRGLITKREIEMMVPGVILINTSRGGMINEHDLAQTLSAGHVGAAALDVFSQEPYSGELITQERCLLTCHMGSMSKDCRTRMELEATTEAIRFLKGEPLLQSVPEEEYSERVC